MNHLGISRSIHWFEEIKMIKDHLNKLFDDSKDECVYDFELLSFAEDVLLNNKLDIPPLFRFSSADYSNIRGLETQTLFLSPVGNMNDIFEGLSCEIDDRVLEVIEKMADCAYLKSFSEDKSNLLMWAHYADQYSGMCVQYNFSEFCDDILCHLFPVHYSNTRRKSKSLEYTVQELISIKKANAENYYPEETNYLKDIMYLFLSKSKAWKYEKEWRIVATHPQIFNSSEELDDECSSFYDINNQIISVKGCIEAVYLGPRMKEMQRKHIIEICKDKLSNVPVFSVSLSKDKYELEYRQLPDTSNKEG